MKIPSINYLFTQAKSGVLQYPLSLVAAFIGVCIGMYLVQFEKSITNAFPYINIMLCSAIGIPLFFCIETFLKTITYKPIIRFALNGGGIILLVILYFTFPTSEQTFNVSLPYVKYAIYNIAVHLLVSFAPFIKTKEINGFWQFNKILFIRMITSAIFSGTLYVGITLALVSLNLLFDVKINEKLYFEIFIFIAGFFNTWFFVAGIPKNIKELEQVETYPQGLKIFTQYILLPLLALYLIILYSYSAKIIAVWDWPRGIVSYLIVCVAVLGIFNFLLMYPYAKLKENTWVKHSSRAYYFILIPLIVLLFIAISMRLNDYGITINRYIIFLLGTWLSVVSLYFAIGKNNIKFVPISLFFTVVLVSFGPWGMFSVSEKSQSNRLRHILEENNLLNDGKYSKEQTISIDSLNYRNEFVPQNQQLLNDSIKGEIKSILDYLDDNHGFNSIKDWFSQDFDSQIIRYNSKKERWQHINEAEVYMHAMGFDYTYYTLTEDMYISYSIDNSEKLFSIKGYEYEIHLYGYFYKNNDGKIDSPVLSEFKIDSANYAIKTSNSNENLIEIYKNDTLFSKIDLIHLTNKLVDKYGTKQQYNIPINNLTLEDTTKTLNFKLIINNISYNKKSNKLNVNTYDGTLYFTLKE